MEGKISIRNARFAKIGLQDLCNYIKDNYKVTKDFIMVEIGSFVGDSTEIFARNFPLVESVDPWESGYDDNDLASHPDKYNMDVVEAQFDELCKQLPNIHKNKTTSMEFVKELDDRSLDGAYVDGRHTEESVTEDIKALLPKIKKDGFIAGHDYHSKHFPGVKKAVNKVLGEPDEVFRDSSWIKRVV